MRSLARLAAASITVVSAALLVAGGSAPARAADDTGPLAGRLVFAQHCARCHDDDATRKTYGPSLIGVVGRKAGTQEGFPYSEALKNSGLVWTEEALRAWMANNDGLLPGTRMRHVGVTDGSEQDVLIGYLKALKK
jgi:cytochrome c